MPYTKLQLVFLISKNKSLSKRHEGFKQTDSLCDASGHHLL